MGRTDDIVLECRNLSHGFGAKPVIHDFSLKIIRGEIVALVGPSGCGKSTLLRALVGTHPCRQGEVLIAKKEEAGLGPVRAPGRDRGIVYQQYSLFPFLTARDNVALGPLLDRTSLPRRLFRPFSTRKFRRAHRAEADALLDRLSLGEAGRLYPSEMSGGMRQRVAIAQALIMKPEILLLDEPFGALDEATREELQRLLLTLYQENCRARKNGNPPPYTILIVTHELNEAIYVGDRVVGLSQYWNWKERGHPRCPGATKVYDRVSPVFTPDQERDFSVFAGQRAELRQAAFDPDIPTDPTEHDRFWDEVRQGKGEGVLA